MICIRLERPSGRGEALPVAPGHPGRAFEALGCLRVFTYGARVSGALVIFDLDGTVWDSAPGILACLRSTLDALSLPVPSDEGLRAVLGPPILSALTQLGVPDVRLDEARALYRAAYRDRGERDATVYDGIVPLLDGLRTAGVTLATATSKGRDPAVRMLQHFDLADRFDIVAAETMDALNHTKIDVIADALRQAGDPDPGDVTMIGDRAFDVEGGNHFGCRTIGVRWGYAQPGELEAAAPSDIAITVAGLEGLLLS